MPEEIERIVALETDMKTVKDTVQSVDQKIDNLPATLERYFATKAELETVKPKVPAAIAALLSALTTAAVFFAGLFYRSN